MAEEIDFNSLNIKLPELVKTYSLEKQQEVFDYLCEMDDHHKKAYKIALNHLGSSFNICRSNGFQDWKAKKSK